MLPACLPGLPVMPAAGVLCVVFCVALWLQVMTDNPLADFVELPEEYRPLCYSNMLPGIIRGALEMVRAGCHCCCCWAGLGAAVVLWLTDTVAWGCSACSHMCVGTGALTRVTRQGSHTSTVQHIFTSVTTALGLHLDKPLNGVTDCQSSRRLTQRTLQVVSCAKLPQHTSADKRCSRHNNCCDSLHPVLSVCVCRSTLRWTAGLCRTWSRGTSATNCGCA